MNESEKSPFDGTPFHYHAHQEHDNYTIELTRNEVLYLDDSFTLMIETERQEQRITAMRPIQMTAGLAVPMELMEKVGKAIVFTTKPYNEDKIYPVDLDISELLMIREISSSFIKVGDEPVVYNLKRKVCDLLYGAEVEKDERDKLEKDERDKLAQQLLKDININLSEVNKSEQRQADS